ncbi:MAG: hydroxymethylbilane synthase [Actinomycetales bacterium]|nr:MAG: hydroxymethylbilane synthase [Actinomycetales bacterium]
MTDTTPTAPLRLGTRASVLARTQSGHVAQRITELTGRDVELVTISTEGDRSSALLTTIGGTGVFVAALREAVARGDVDLAVHSLKDLPTTPDDRLNLVAIPPREDARDVLVARDGLTLGELPQGARVGTGSPRRAAQINALGLGLEIVPVRGNVDTRIAKVTSGELDGVVLARAGLVRLGRQDEATEVLDPIQVLPAPGQGALAVECRADDTATADLLVGLDDPDTRAAVTAERSLLASLEAGCSAPVGALAEIAWGDDGHDELWLRAVVGDVSGAPSIRLSAAGSPAESAAVGERLAAEMLAEGAADLVATAQSSGSSPVGSGPAPAGPAS